VLSSEHLITPAVFLSGTSRYEDDDDDEKAEVRIAAINNNNNIFELM
jgi:hypothetical protein